MQWSYFTSCIPGGCQGLVWQFFISCCEHLMVEGFFFPEDSSLSTKNSFFLLEAAVESCHTRERWPCLLLITVVYPTALHFCECVYLGSSSAFILVLHFLPLENIRNPLQMQLGMSICPQDGISLLHLQGATQVRDESMFHTSSKPSFPCTWIILCLLYLLMVHPHQR